MLVLPMWYFLSRYQPTHQFEVGLLATDTQTFYRHVIKFAAAVSILAFFAGYSWYLSLHITIPSANNAIYQSSCAFVFVFSVLLLKEKVTLPKILAVIVAIGGVLLVTLFHSKGNVTVHDRPIGYVLVLVSTCLYALYEVLAKLYGPHSVGKRDQLKNACLLLGLIGFFNFILLWPGIFLLHFTGLEEFSWPSDPKTVRLMILNMFLDTMFNWFLLFGLALSSPLFISIGSMLVIPASLTTDAMIHSVHPSLGVIFGCLLIALAFCLLHLNQRKEESSSFVAVHDVSEESPIVVNK
eukprot:c6622_g1_i1.p1 GENE.c6622_g1_i1~~c6622_g1_i1.p1  ORF type:complete len:296 (-),score=13.82 c6622_g1_i1:46-933(-)